MQKFLADPEGLGRGYPVIAASSEQFSYADPVYINTSGFLAVFAQSTNPAVLGYYCGQGETMSSTNETVAKVCPDYVPAFGVEMVFGSDQDCTQTDVGDYCDMGTTTTGAYELDLAAGQSNESSFFILGFDPDGESDNDKVVVMAAQPQYYAYAAV
ncbi:MAG: hypothetical protein WC917_00765 [Bacilli bacterium]|jgi:hypothetical protein